MITKIAHHLDDVKGKIAKLQKSLKDCKTEKTKSRLNQQIQESNTLLEEHTKIVNRFVDYCKSTCTSSKYAKEFIELMAGSSNGSFKTRIQKSGLQSYDADYLMQFDGTECEVSDSSDDESVDDNEEEEEGEEELGETADVREHVGDRRIHGENSSTVAPNLPFEDSSEDFIFLMTMLYCYGELDLDIQDLSHCELQSYSINFARLKSLIYSMVESFKCLNGENIMNEYNHTIANDETEDGEAQAGASGHQAADTINDNSFQLEKEVNTAIETIVNSLKDNPQIAYHSTLPLEAIIWSATTILSMVQLIDEVGIHPFVQVVDKGLGSSVFCNIHKFVHIMSYQSRKKVAKSVMILLGNMNRWTRERPDLLRLLLSTACSNNDLHIETYNSRCSQNLPTHTLIEQSHLVQASSDLGMEYYVDSFRGKNSAKDDEGNIIITKSFCMAIVHVTTVITNRW
jgi:hypothetical protein